MLFTTNTQLLRPSAISNNKTSIPRAKKGLSIFSSSSDDDLDLNITTAKKSIKEKREQQPTLSKSRGEKVETVEERRNQNLEKQHKLGNKTFKNDILWGNQL